MIRKDPALDSDRAHYYSQFWIEVAAGRPIGQSAQPTAEEDEEDELDESDLDMLMGATPVPAPHVELKPKPKAPEKKDTARSLTSLADLASIADLMNQSAQMEEDTVPDIEADAGDEPEIVTNFGLDEVPADEEASGLLASEEGEEEEPFDDFEEEEEEDEWGGSRRPKPKKPPRRDRRGF